MFLVIKMRAFKTFLRRLKHNFFKYPGTADIIVHIRSSVIFYFPLPSLINFVIKVF